MTDAEKYKAGQEASGIAVGDTVKVVRTAEDYSAGWTNSWNAVGMLVGLEWVVKANYGTSGFNLNQHYTYPYFVLEIVKKANGDVPNVIAETEITGECTMKTQELFNVAVTENEKVKDDNGQIESVKVRVIFSQSDMPAYDKGNATVKAVLAAGKVTGVKGIKDPDEVEVKVSSPF